MVNPIILSNATHHDSSSASSRNILQRTSKTSVELWSSHRTIIVSTLLEVCDSRRVSEHNSRPSPVRNPNRANHYCKTRMQSRSFIKKTDARSVLRSCHLRRPTKTVQG